MPVTIDAKPVRAPSATPAALSMYVVLDETPPAPPRLVQLPRLIGRRVVRQDVIRAVIPDDALE